MSTRLWGFGGKVYVLGGASASGTVTGLVQIYDPATDGWSTGAAMPTPRAAAIAGALCNQIIVFGGVDPVLGNLSVTEIYDPADDTWSTCPSMPIPMSEVAQGPTQTTDTIFSVGSGIFGVTGTTAQALAASDCPTAPESLPNRQIPCTGLRCRVLVTCNLPQSQGTRCTDRIDVFAFVRRGPGPLSGDTRFAFATANVPPGETGNVRVRLTSRGRRIAKMGSRFAAEIARIGRVIQRHMGSSKPYTELQSHAGAVLRELIAIAVQLSCPHCFANGLWHEKARLRADAPTPPVCV